MNKDCKKYLGELKTLTPSAGKYEKKFIQNMKEDLIEFSSDNPDVSYVTICEHFGTPQDIIIDYFENVDTTYLIKKLRFSSIIRKCIICAILILALTCTIKTGLYYKAYHNVQEHSVDYWTETIH